MTFPTDWTVKPLEQLVQYESGRTPARANSSFWEGSGERVPWVAISDMENYGIVTKTKETITKAAFDQIFRNRVVRVGTLIMSFKLTIGRVATLGIDACHNEAIISIYPKLGVNQRYLGYYLSQVDYEELQDRQVKGNTLNQDKINRIPVALPPLREQLSVADVLDKIRSAIALQQKALTCAEELKRVALRELFTRGLRGEAQKETDLGLVPQGWEVVRIGDQATVVSKGASPKWQGFEYVPSGVLFVRSQNVGDGQMDFSEKAFLPPEWNEKEKRSVLQSNDVLINLVGASIGRVAVGGDEIDRANCNQAVCFVRLVRELVLPTFLCGFLLTNEGQKQIHLVKKDIARANLSLEDVRNILIPRPKIEEQAEIVAVLDAIHHKIDLQKRKKTALDELFKALLHKFMTGEIRVADLDLSVLKGAQNEAEATA